MNNLKQEKLLIELNEAHSKREQQNKELSQTFGKDLNQAQYKKDKALSDDAYPDNAHFIYEIIQNAEDSLYLKNKKAELEFHLLSNGILVLSNQDGFTDDDIRSICVMASGGKIAKKDQFIGEKGLGFRSVFKITTTPCISSNGYQFYFDKKQSYEKPFLLKDYENSLPTEFSQYNDTAIFLPYSINKNEIEELENDFQSKIKPKLILFLKKLNSISVIKNSKKYMFIEKENSKSENFELSKLKDSNQKQDFYITRRTIDVSGLSEEKRKGIQEREIVLAYSEDIEETSTNIFAFLPTDIDSRLNFTIQADFLLDTSRGHILENEWNQNIFKEIKSFIISNINLFKNHSKLKFDYLKYYLQETKSNNKFIDNLYSQTINEIRNNDLILSENETWQKPNNILLIEDNIKIDTRYLKLLFGENYEQVHSKFKLNEYFIKKFNIRKINKKEVIESACAYFDNNNLNDFDRNVIFELSEFLAKYLSTDSRSGIYEKNLFDKVRKSLPIIPKYESNKKFYLYDSIYISSEYKPKFLIENIVKENEFDFTKYNFLADDYLKDKRLTDLIKNIIEEQEKDKNKKTIEFFIKYPEVLQSYLQKDIESNYKKIFDFLIVIQEDNKEKISKIPLLLVQNRNFYNSNNTLYFSNDSDSDIDVLDENLLELVQKEHKYREFLEKVFKVKEADIINIVLNEYLPWVKKIYQNRTVANDSKIIKYTKDIIENFDKFDKEDKDKIKQSLFFISSNQKDKYLKSSNIYLSQNLMEIIFSMNSIEKYISNKSYFDFLDGSYDQIISSINNEEKTKEFFKYFSFEINIKENDISNFIKLVKQDLDLDLNIEALDFITKSIPREDRKNIKDLEDFKVYSQNQILIEIKNLFENKVNDLDMDYLHSKYRKKIADINLRFIKQYFQSEYKIEPFIKYLKKDIDFEEATKVYQHLDSKSEFNPNNKNDKNRTITTEKIRKEFKNCKLIYQKNGDKLYPTDVTWKEEKSNSKFFALSVVYPQELQNFFIKKVQVSQVKDIKQIIKHIKEIKEKSTDYFDLLIDLNDLVTNDDELIKYINSYENPIKDQFDTNIYEYAKQFILKKEQLFILDNNKKNSDENFYFNDLEFEGDNKKIENLIFTVDDKYPKEYYAKLIDTLKIKRLSNLDKHYDNSQFMKEYNVESYRLMLDFAYDLLFTKFPDEYKELKNREIDLKELNNVITINVYEDIISKLMINDMAIELTEVKYYFENEELFIVDTNELFKIIAKKIGFISDKDLKDFYNEVIEGNCYKEKYYEKEKISKKQNFILEISNITVENIKSNKTNEHSLYKETNIYKNEKDIDSYNNQSDSQSAEEERKNRQKLGKEQVQKYNNDKDNSENQTSPSSLEDREKYEKIYKQKKIEKQQEISNNSQKVSERTKKKSSDLGNNNYRVGEEKTKEFFRKRDQYLGQCQICGFTFKANKNVNYCERFTWSDYTKVKTKTDFIDPGNSLCLCAKCHSIIKGGGDFEATFLTTEIFDIINDDYDFDTFIEDINSDKLLNAPECFQEHIEFNDMYFVDIRLNNKYERIYFTEEHLLIFFIFLNS
jgi:hypothetical protein